MSGKYPNILKLNNGCQKGNQRQIGSILNWMEIKHSMSQFAECYT